MLPDLVDSVLTLDDGVATLRFDRHDVRNAITGTHLADEIVRVCTWASDARAVGVLVLTGNGTAFSAGGNIHDMLKRKGMFGGTPMEMQQSYRTGIQRMARAVYDIDVPTIAAVNGSAIGAGLDLATMCDIRIGSTNAKMGETFVNLGILPGDGGAWFLPRAIGMQRAAELTFSGRIIDAAEAVEIGLLMEAVAPDALMPRCLDLARSFAAKPRDALRIAKRLLRSGQRMALPDFLDSCASLQSLCHTTQEHDAALRAVVDTMRR